MLLAEAYDSNIEDLKHDAHWLAFTKLFKMMTSTESAL